MNDDNDSNGMRYLLRSEAWEWETSERAGEWNDREGGWEGEREGERERVLYTYHYVTQVVVLARIIPDEEQAVTSAAGIKLLVDILQESDSEVIQTLAADCIARLAHTRAGEFARVLLECWDKPSVQNCQMNFFCGTIFAILKFLQWNFNICLI